MDTVSKKPQAKYEPGELQKTRENIGDIEREEAELMMKRLGGEIGVEKPEIIDDEVLKKVRSARKFVPGKNRKKKDEQAEQAERRDSLSRQGGSVFSIGERTSAVISGLPGKKYRLPHLSQRQKQLFDKLMISREYHIRNAPGFFAMLFSFGRGGPERVADSFIKNDLTAHIRHIDLFIESMQTLILAVPPSYKNKINTDNDFSFRALRIIYNWDTLPVKAELSLLKKKSSWILIEDTVPFIKELYRPLIQLYFLGELEMTRIIKKAYGWTVKTQIREKANIRCLNAARQAAAEWLYIFGQVIKGAYPLLMRMCVNEFETYPDFYTKRISDIMRFLEITKYDIVLPKKNEEKEKVQKTAQIKAEGSEAAKAEESPKGTEETKKENIPEEKPGLILQSLGVLDKLFPEAGWLHLADRPDLYPYFQPLYSFPDGFNLLAPNNPLQVTIVLLRIIEDFFQGCRNIPLNPIETEDTPLERDNLQKIFSDWTLYREYLFDRLMVPALKEYVNHAYTQSDFRNSRYAKRELSNWMWQIKFYFHPHLVFEITSLEYPRIDNSYIPLPERIRALVQVFSDMIRQADASESSMPTSLSDIYIFDVENTVSYRLNLLLGGSKSKERTNLNLMKYTLCALRVLDWWINDKNSYAYVSEQKVPYRTLGEGDLQPLLSVPVRSDQRDVFLRNIRLMHEAQKSDVASMGNSAQNAAPASQA